MTRVLVVGEINVDLILGPYHVFPAPGREVLVDDAVMTLGSASAIVATGLAKLGTSVAFVGLVGADAWGDHCLETMYAVGVDVTRVTRSPSLRTGLTVSISSSRDRALVTFLGSIAALGPDDVGTLPLAGFSHLHVSSYYLQSGLRPALPDLLERARASGLTTSLDPGFDPDERWDGISDLLPRVDVFLPNEVELEGLTGIADVGAALEALQNGHTLTVAKLGARGCAVRVDGALLREAPPTTEPVDTTGAGDSFNAGFLDAWLRDVDLAGCLRAAAFCGAASTMGVGGATAQATRADVEAYLGADGSGP